ncbi:MAG: hypothetical protein QNL24_12895 [Akkermansiaceae bacterium]
MTRNQTSLKPVTSLPESSPFSPRPNLSPPRPSKGSPPNLSADDSKSLCLAACRDLLPAPLSEEVSFSETQPNILAESSAPYNRADDQTAAILRKIRRLVQKDQTSKEWLHLTAKWFFPD